MVYICTYKVFFVRSTKTFLCDKVFSKYIMIIIFSDGALLSIVWSSGRLQYFPMLFINPAKAEVDHLVPSSCLLSSSPGGAEFAPKIYSSPAL